MWSQYLKKFKEVLQEAEKTETTITAYIGDLKQFFAFSKEKDLSTPEEATTEHIENFLKSLRAKNYSIKSVSRKLNTVRTFYRMMKDKGEFEDDPANSINHPKIPGKAPRVLNETEYLALKEVCRPKPRLFAVIELLLQTGMKIGELCRLELDDIKYKNKKAIEIYIKPHHKNEGRWIPLNPKASEALAAYIKVRPKTKSKAIFVSSTGRPVRVRNLRTYIMRAFQKAAIKNSTVNDLRNTFIVQQLKRGTNLVDVSKIVGHKRLSTTEKYLEFVDKEVSSTPSLPEL